MKGVGYFLRNNDGAAASEMALVLPLLAYLFLNVADVSMYIWSKMQVDLAAQEAVGAVRSRCDTAAELPATTQCTNKLSDLINNTMLPAAQSTSLGARVTIATPVENWYCATLNASGKSVLTVVAGVKGKAPPDCSKASSGSTASPGDYISTTASLTFSPIFPGATIVSMVPALNQPITSTAWIRLQ